LGDIPFTPSRKGTIRNRFSVTNSEQMRFVAIFRLSIEQGMAHTSLLASFLLPSPLGALLSEQSVA